MIQLIVLQRGVAAGYPTGDRINSRGISWFYRLTDELSQTFGLHVALKNVCCQRFVPYYFIHTMCNVL